MMMIIIAAIIFISFLLIVVWLCEKLWWTPIHIQKLMRSQGIKGPSYKFLHGNTKEILETNREITSKPMEHLSHDIFPRVFPHIYSWRKIYGANFLYWYGPQPDLVVTEPELVKEILCDRENYPKVELQSYTKKLIGDGVTSSNGEKWVKMRKLSNIFHGENLKGMFPAMVDSTESMLEKWRENEGKEIEVIEEFRLLTSDVISKTAFGSSYLEGKEIFEMLVKLAILIPNNAHKIRFPFLSKILKNNDEIESEKLEKGIRDGIIQIIKKKEQTQIGDNNNNNNGKNSKTDFLVKLLEVNNDDEKNIISLEDIIDEVKTFYVAGQETSTSFLGWAILLLATHEDWQERARKEAIDMFCHHNSNPADYGIGRMKIMNMILEETLRLYPPVSYMKRKVEKKVGQWKLTQVHNNTMQLYISPIALHNDPEIWGEDVHFFKPERFAQGVVKATKNNPIAFMPFGYGPRTCLGQKFAMAQAKIVLSMILQRYKIKLSPTYVHSPVQLFTLRPEHGIQVILHRS